MGRWDLSQYVITGCIAAALLAGCGGSQPPTGAPVTKSQTSGMDSVLPFWRHLSSAGGQLQYVTGAYLGSLEEFDYPKSDSPIHYRRLGHKSYAECTKGSQTFWVVEETSHQVVEFDAGRKFGKPIKTLTVPGAPSSIPWDCSVDPTTGNLEVSLLGASSVVIFTNAGGSGQVISDKLGGTGWSAYDAQGDLFVEGSISQKFALVELPKGQAEFQEISLPRTITGLSGLSCCTIRWDGTYLAWMAPAGGIVYRLSISGNQAYLEGTITLSRATYCSWFWIWAEAGVLFCGTGGHYVNVYDYPAGGSPIALLGPMKLGEAVGVVSLQP